MQAHLRDRHVCDTVKRDSSRNHRESELLVGGDPRRCALTSHVNQHSNVNQPSHLVFPKLWVLWISPRADIWTLTCLHVCKILLTQKVPRYFGYKIPDDSCSPSMGY